VGTTNHCPMALIALARMGAAPARLQEFFDTWIRKYNLELLEPLTEVLHVNNWVNWINQPNAFDALKSYFTHRLKTESSSRVLLELVTEVPFAPATGAFHALIRIAYAIEHAHLHELASGMAAYVVGYQPLPLPHRSALIAASVQDGLNHLLPAYHGSRWTADLITSRFTDITSERRFGSLIQRPPDCADVVAQMSKQAIRIYGQTKSFTALHMVTGLFAARLVLEKIQHRLNPKILDALWSAYCVAYVSIGAPKESAVVDEEDQSEVPNWQLVFNCAVQSDDDHLVKMAYTCWQEFLYSGNRQYWRAAKLATQLTCI
jgi:Questin oxidase-like